MAKKRGTVASQPRNDSGRNQTRRWKFYLTLIASFVVVIAMLAMLFLPEGMDSVPVPVPVDLQTLLRCAELCSKGPSEQDKQFASRAPAHVKKLVEQDLTRACVMRCEAGLKKPEEMRDALPLDTFKHAPKELNTYLAKARQCALAPLRSTNEAAQALETCGVVHLPAGLIDSDVLANLQSAFHELRANASEYNMRASNGNLREERVEIWPPFRWPFNASALLRPKALVSIIKEYLGEEPVFDHISIIVSPASKKLSSQRLHADIISAHRHIEVHIPLSHVTSDMGPTQFCPASHGFVRSDCQSSGTDSLKCSSTSGIAYALEQWYFAQGRCQEDSSLSYAKPLEFGQSTIYDSNVWHAGSENVGRKDRAVLQLSWAANDASLQQRDYLIDTFSKDTSLTNNLARQQAILADTESFRLVARGS